MGQVAADRRLGVEVLGDLQARAAVAVDRAQEGRLHRPRQLLHQLLDDLADQVARQGEHFLVHQVLGVQHGLEQRHVRPGAAEQVGVGHHLVELVALQGVLLDPLDGLLGEERVHGVDPVGHGELRIAEAAGFRCRALRGRCGPGRIRGRRGSPAPGPARRRGPSSEQPSASSAPWPRTSRQRTSRSLVAHREAPRNPNRSTAWNSLASNASARAAYLGADLQCGQRLFRQV